MKLKFSSLIITAFFVGTAQAKTFQNSFLAFDVPDNWTCLQEGVAWTCTPLSSIQSKEALIVIASKVAGPEDNLGNFKGFLSQPKNIRTKVGTPMPSKVMYAQERILAGTKWIQAQHLGSEIQDYYTLYLATVKDQLAISIQFTAEHDKYQSYNAIFDKAMKTLKIVANQQLLFPKKKDSSVGEQVGIQPVAPAPINPEDLLPPPEKKPKSAGFLQLILVLAFIGAGIGFYLFQSSKKSNSRPKSKPRPRP